MALAVTDKYDLYNKPNISKSKSQLHTLPTIWISHGVYDIKKLL